MIFQRTLRLQARAISPQRLAAAKRAVQKEKDEVPLFPELVRQPDPVARIHDKDAEFAEHWQTIRDYHARTWRRCRAALRAMPAPERAKILAHWNRGIYPATAEYLASLLHSIRTGRFDIDRYYAEIEHSRALVQRLNADRFSDGTPLASFASAS